MRISTLAFVALLAGAGSAAAASREVQYGPAPSWLKPPPAATEREASPGAPVRLVYADWQSRLEADSGENYTSYRIKILKPEGLAAGNLTGTWNPAIEDLIVHRLNIIRDGQVINLLATTKFRVLERENNLDYAVLDGALTATLQAPGLQVGDEIEFAATVRRRDATFAGRSAGIFQLPFLSTPGAYRLRLAWPTGVNVLWRATPDLGTLTPHTEGAETVLDEELRDPATSPLTDGAPPRFNLRRQLQYSQFTSWADIAHVLWPLFDHAAALSPASPLRAEAARIAASTNDPTRRAEAALRLVQDGIRYVYVGLDGGAYRPAAADETWARKFGDCKAKSVLLLVLLHELGIESEPVLVTSTGGDATDLRLPMPDAFDHVVVRAKIGDKSYWLDGTRLGDRRLDALPAPRSRWALALRSGPVELEPIKAEAPIEPLVEEVLDVDATAGFEALAKVRAEEAFRTDDVQQVRLQLSGLAPDDAERAVKAHFRQQYPWVDPDAASWRFDEVAGALVFDMTGEGKPDWKGDDAAGRSLDIYSAGFTPPNELRRPKDQDQAAPWLTEFPSFKRWTTIIRLPPANAKWGWAFEALPVDEQLGGVAYWREAELSGGVVRTTMSRRSVLPEITADQAREIGQRLPKFNNNISQVYQVPAKTVRGTGATSPADFTSDLAGGISKLLANMGPDPGIPIVQHAQQLIKTGRTAEGLAALDSLAAGETAGPGALFIGATFATEVGDTSRALALADAGLKRSPSEVLLLQFRASINARVGHFAEALADADQSVRLRPEERVNFLTRGEMLDALGRREEALADLDEAWRMDPLDVGVLVERSKLLYAVGRHAEAMALYEPWIASDKTGVALNARCWTTAISNVELPQAEADCAAAVKLGPQVAAYWDSYALVALRSARLDDALARYNRALVIAPEKAASRYGRGLVEIRRGDRPAGLADIAAAKAANPAVDHDLTQAGVTP